MHTRTYSVEVKCRRTMMAASSITSSVMIFPTFTHSDVKEVMFSHWLLFLSLARGHTTGYKKLLDQGKHIK